MKIQEIKKFIRIKNVITDAAAIAMNCQIMSAIFLPFLTVILHYTVAISISVIFLYYRIYTEKCLFHQTS